MNWTGMEIEQLLFALELEEGEVFKMSSNTLHGKMSTEHCKLRESGGKIG
jgi:transcriptional antiterminator Rof (Rho-off)